MNRNPNGNPPVAGMILAILALLSILGGLVAFFNGVHEIYATLNNSGSSGNLSIDSVSGTVGNAMTGISSGVGMGLVGAILAFIALIGRRFSPKWFVWTLLVLAPFGTIVGVIFLVLHYLSGRAVESGA